MQRGMRVVRAMALGLLYISAICGAQGSQTSSPASFEPPLRDLWARGSERFQRQWLIAGPVDVQLSVSVDPSALKPAARQLLTPQAPSVRWMPHTAWSDVTDLNVSPPRAVEYGDEMVDRFVFAAASMSSTDGGPAELSIGSDRPYSVWLNGTLIHTRQSAEAFSPDQDRIPVELTRGENLVLLRFHEASVGPSQFSVRAVPPGSALRRIDEVTPSVLPSPDDTLAVRTHFKTEQEAVPVVVQVIAAGGDVVARQSGARGEVVRFDATAWRDGAYEVRISTQDAWQQTQVRYLPWYKGDPMAAAHRLIAAADAASDDVPGDSLRMLAALAKDRLGGALDKASRSSWPLIHSALMEFEELQLEAQGRIARARPSGFVRIAYEDAIDGSTQFCRAYLPADYSAARPWPLIVTLHGFNPANPEYVDWWSIEQRHHRIAETKATIVIEPHGRGNAQYLGIGDRDVMRCLDEAKRRFTVDADRVYLMGESMGGHGTWAIATRHPDVFAAVAPIFGGWDFRISNISGPSTAPPPRTSLDAFSLERGSSFANAESLLHVPLLIVHGDADPAVNVEHSRHAARMMQRWGYNVRYHEMPGWAHEDLGQHSAIADWMLTHRRIAAPRTIRIRSTDLAGAAAYWIRVRTFQRPAEVIRVAAEVLEPGLVRIDSSNVAALTLDLPASLRDPMGKVQIVWNGQTHQPREPSGVIELGTRASSGLHKRAGLEGPLPAVLATPFVVVVGTVSPEERMREQIQARANAFSRQWHSWQHQPLRMMKDTEVTAEHEKAYSLILLGGADANAVTRRIAKKLPFSASRNGIVVDGRKWPVQDSVLQAIYPSPLAADRYVYVIAATSADGMFFFRPQLVHTVFGYPLTMFDWIIQDGRRPPPGTPNVADANVAVGVFDASWRSADDRWTKARDPQTASQWALRRAPTKSGVASPSALQAVAGKYEMSPGAIVTISVQGDRVVAEPPGGEMLELVPEGDTMFSRHDSGEPVEFIRDDAGNISGAFVEHQGALLWAKRLPNP
ncbi:prolyl oligopeptidase family serine peptidase [Steroidobacter sp. S1-65]|uniref:Prolyl oligopeptidase family serine peptidase n=1 Tax=Steroidobacter gossypii TaxID=2805490 RepID=A0ABS1X053_9GAMM|nr:prolyl oligopeptidase family serine peptidase [Steroidobacter gossypii]MBM0106588.1 prolyl oligopeptidase family serine peptidase [Steroidobacter gossypii]